MRRIAMSVAASTMTFSLVGCGALNASGDAADASPTKGDDVTVGLLLPEKDITRYDQFDYPTVKETVASLTHNKGRTVYKNADQDPDTQNAQMQQMIDDGIDVILLSAVDSHGIAPMVRKAKDAGIPVIAYDRLAEGPIDLYISFDNELVGEVQGRALIEALGTDVDTSDKIVMINGSPTDSRAKQFKAGALNELNGQVTIAKSYDTDGWNPEIAETEMAEAIVEIGAGNIAGVYSANDAMVTGIIKSFTAAGVTDLPPITGQDAELAAVQRVITGDQLMTVYNSYPTEAEDAARAAILKVQGKDVEFDSLVTDSVDSPTNKEIPTRLVPVVALTQDNIKQTVISDGIYTLKEICTAEYKSACQAIGLK